MDTFEVNDVYNELKQELNHIDKIYAEFKQIYKLAAALTQKI